ncbi:MAG: type II secretion system ATPase GspE [Gammaproteobacteria bacterium]|nr:type II secretion system ATPase GspE [Gammaproteobacteria bacterium]
MTGMVESPAPELQLEEVADEALQGQPEQLAEADEVGLPYKYAASHEVLLKDGVLYHTAKLTLPVILELRRCFAHSFKLQEVGEEDFKQRLTRHYHVGDDAARRAVDDLDAEIDLSQLVEEMPEEGDILSDSSFAPVIRLINAILSRAVQDQASDVHIEPFEDRVAVRFRVDGVLSEVLAPKPGLAAVLVSRLKVMARLDIAEKRLPQDGRITVRLAGHAVDVRMSTIPSAYGERVVLRLLDKQAGQLLIDQLGMPAALQRDFAAALKKPHGIILVTGPTGSGKTTTLYAGLSHINDRKRNILTIEDPIEYLLPGVGQTQVNQKVEMTFARGLRAILRQDPDIVMVGEIRDSETAAIAVQASLTGHLVLSTLHTNTAIGAITRLLDMGVQPFLLSSSLEAILAQRLVRRLCPECKKMHPASASQRQLLDLPEGCEIGSPVGCAKCGHSGYRGRMGIYELIVVDEALRQLIHDRSGEQVLLEHARKYSEALVADGRRQVLSGATSLEEVLRVTQVAR